MTNIEPNKDNIISYLQQQLSQKCMEAAAYWDGMQQLAAKQAELEVELSAARAAACYNKEDNSDSEKELK